MWLVSLVDSCIVGAPEPPGLHPSLSWRHEKLIVVVQWRREGEPVCPSLVLRGFSSSFVSKWMEGMMSGVPLPDVAGWPSVMNYK